MIQYITKIKCLLRDLYGFKPLPGSTPSEPLLDVPDGDYPMQIDGRLDRVMIVNGRINCCRFDKTPSKASRRKALRVEREAQQTHPK